jgi:WD40 repeat protein
MITQRRSLMSDPIPHRSVGLRGDQPAPVKSFTFASGVHIFALVSVGMAWCLIAGNEASPEPTAQVVLDGSTSIQALAVASDGKRLATTDAAGIVRVWCADTGRCRVLPAEVAEHGTCVGFSPDAATMAVGYVNRTVTIRDVVTGAVRGSALQHPGRVRTVAFCPAGTTLASGSANKVLLWDVADRRVKAQLEGHTEAVTVVAFAPDGRTLLSGGQDGTIRFWDATTGKIQRIIPAHSSAVLSAIFSPDGRTAASVGDRDARVRLWDVATGQELKCLRGQAEMEVSIAFATDGETLASGDSLGNLTIWDLESARQRASWKAHAGWIKSVVFSPGGRTLVSAGSDGEVKFWEIAARTSGSREALPTMP